MFPALSFHALLHGEAEQRALLALKLLRKFVMDPRIPDEVRVQKVPHVVAARFICVPPLHSQPVDLLQNGILVPIEPRIGRPNVADSLRDLEAHLEPHRAFWQRSDQSLQRVLRAVSQVVVVIEAVQPGQFVAGHEASVNLHHHAVEVFADRQQLAKCGLPQRLFLFGQCAWHHHLKNSFVNSRSGSRPQ